MRREVARRVSLRANFGGFPPPLESVRWRRGEQQDLKPVYQDNCDTIKSNIFNHTFTSVLSVLDHDPFSTKATSFNYG